ncbi:MAG: hypothetical protein U0W24_24410 [Bacteroidales bacterium]
MPRCFIIFHCLFAVLSGCTGKTENHDLKIETEQVNHNIYQTNENKLEEPSSDIYYIEKKSIVFFSLGNREAQNLIAEIGESYRWETEALLNSFREQAKSFQSVLKKQNIKSNFCTHKKFAIKLDNGKEITFDRLKNEQILGQILTDGKKEPLICFGMYKNDELAELIKTFFGIADLGIIPVDTLKVNTEKPVDSTAVNLKK